MRIAILSPIQNSLYSRLVTHLAYQEPGIEVVQIVVRSIWSWNRIRGELRRDGVRLLNKVYNKLVLGGEAYTKSDIETIIDLAKSQDLPGKSLTDLSKLYRIPLLTIKDHNDAEAITALAQAKPDVIVFTGGGLLRKEILSTPNLGVLNCHAGLLPQYRGMDVVEWPILEAGNRTPQIGLTLHYMDRGVDTGPILKTYPMELLPGGSIEAIRTRIEPAMVRLVIEGLQEIRDGKLAGKTQMKSEGKQYFVMHPRVKKAAADKLLRK